MVSNYGNEIAEYLKKNLLKGYTLESLKIALINQGYPRIFIDRAIEEMNKNLAKTAPILKEKPKITHQILDENDSVLIIKKHWWKKIFE